GKRAFGLTLLGLQSRLDDGAAARVVFAAAGNMTEETGALAALLDIGAGEAEAAAFHRKWRDDRLVIDKWFGLQTMLAAPDRAAAVADRLTQHPDFDWKNPNRFRAVIGGLSGNAAGFHHPSGDGYRFVADWLIRLDPVNPQTTARMSTAFETWPRYDAARQALMRAELQRIANTKGLSRDTAEMVARMLASPGKTTTAS
ncbi:MAG: aminopeptidase N C-terminal domain-containing protein, partial [Paracoccaceae bacterium]